jgi:hypothetical protein
MIARILGIEESDAFDALQARIEEHSVETYLIPDISSDEIDGSPRATGSILERSVRVMTHKLSMLPRDFEYFCTAFEKDNFNRCSPIGFCFVFKKESE